MSFAMAPEASQTVRVLILDDNVDFAENMAEIVTSRGGEVCVASDLPSAVEKLGQFGPDIVFVDLRLPEGDGEDFVEEVARQRPRALCIVLTGNATIQSAIRAVNAGAFGFLLKDMPVDGIIGTYRRARQHIVLERQKADLERRLQHQEQLAIVGQMAATLAHEIRNPLTGIAQALELLIERVGEPPDVRGLKDSILSRCRGLNELIEDLLSFSKPITIKRQELSLEGLVRSSFGEVELNGDAGKVELRCAITADAETASLDSSYFPLVLKNLFRNAVQAMHASEQKAIDVGARRADGRLFLSIEDLGPGIPEEERSKIFEPFFTTRTRGTGLGLSLTARIVQEHGGTITVDEGKRGGARFTIVIPDETGSPSSS